MRRFGNGSRKGNPVKPLFFELALEDISRAADLFRPTFDQTNGMDGWVSLEVSPVLAYDAASTLAAAKELRARAARPNVFIKIPGTKESLPAIEEAIFAGVPINVTLLFSREQYLAAADAFMRGVERRIAAGLKPDVAFGRIGIRQPLGWRGGRQSPCGIEQPARDRNGQPRLQSLPGAVGLASLAARV